jgi:tRNA modification GTPase
VKTAAESNQVMMLTPAGAAAIAVMRISGPRTREFLASYFSREAISGKPVHGILSFVGDGNGKGSTIDDPVVVIAEDGSWADICLHGGPAILAAALGLAEQEGFEIQSSLVVDAQFGAPIRDIAIQPTKSLLEQEMLAWLPMARTELALRILLDHPSAWEAAGILFDAESGPAKPFAEIPAINPAVILADRSLWHLLRPPRVAIIGVPNAGKSTLANQLFGQQRSITADVPGTTRDWVGEMANINGLAVMLVDTPGIRQADDPLESAAIANSAGEIQRSDLVVLVLDASQGIESQISLRQAWPDALLTINKIDRPPAWDIAKIDGVKISAKTGEGVDQLRKKIAGYFGIDDKSSATATRPRFWTDRQKNVLTQARSAPHILQFMWNRAPGDR